MNHPGLIAGTRHIRWPIAVIVAAFMVIPNLASAQTQPDPPPVAALPPVAITSPAQAPAPYPVQRVVVGMRIVDMEDRGDPIPPGARRVTRRRAPFLIGGIGFLASWLITGTSMFAGVSCTFSGSGPAVCTPWLSAWVWVPVVGAFVGASEVSAMRSPDPGWTGLLVVLGVVQTGFLASAIAGLLMTPKTVVRVPVPIFARTPRRFEWTVAPTLNGLALSGRF